MTYLLLRDYNIYYPKKGLPWSLWVIITAITVAVTAWPLKPGLETKTVSLLRGASDAPSFDELDDDATRLVAEAPHVFGASWDLWWRV